MFGRRGKKCRKGIKLSFFFLNVGVNRFVRVTCGKELKITHNLSRFNTFSLSGYWEIGRRERKETKFGFWNLDS